MNKIYLPLYVENCIDILRKNGYEAYAVGGCVRDCLMGIEPHDYDVTTSAKPGDVRRIFKDAVPTGERFGTITVLFGNEKIEVTTFRSETHYNDFRRPDKIEFGVDLKTDLSRRDFTVNAMAYSHESGLVDFFGGQEDLKNGIIRTVGNAEKRFCEDALRIFRAVRFSARFGFKIEEKTLNAVKRLSHLLKNISLERITEELCKTLCSKYPERAEVLLKAGGLDFIGVKSKKSLDCLCDIPESTVMRLASFFFLCNAPGCEKNLKLSKKISSLVNNTQEIFFSSKPETREDIKRILPKLPEQMWEETFLSYACLHNTDMTFQISEAKDILEKGEPYRVSMLSIDGSDLKNTNISGKEIGKVLNKLLDIVIEHPEYNKKEILIRLADCITSTDSSV